MKSIHWAWSAVLLDLGLFLSPLIAANSLVAFLGVLSVHALASAMVASSTYLLLPTRFKRPRVPVWVLMFNFAFIAPVVGALGMLLLTRFTLKKTVFESRVAVPVSVDLPKFDGQTKDTHRSGQGAIRSRLEGNVPDSVRMQSLLTLQVTPQRFANPILEELLGDSTDDVRLVAFGMLDAQEKKIFAHIQREREALSHDLTPARRLTCLGHLAELHWELVYAGLAQGELRRHMLAQAHQYLDAALDADVLPTSGLLFLKGRILLDEEAIDAAQVAFEQAVKLGQPKLSALPYLAEIAFKRREFGLVKQFMTQLVDLNVAAKTRAIGDLWSGRDTVNHLSDRQYLPHI